MSNGKDSSLCYSVNGGGKASKGLKESMNSSIVPNELSLEGWNS
jgi:hypothetical protein